MWSSPLFWIVFAVALFWALGAYNRLMRMRSAVVQSFGSFDAHMVRLLALLGEFNASCAVHQGDAAVPLCQEIAALHGAATQLSASLAVARARPLRPDAVAALAAARDVLHGSWPGALRKAQEAAASVEVADASSSTTAAPAMAVDAGAAADKAGTVGTAQTAEAATRTSTTHPHADATTAKVDAGSAIVENPLNEAQTQATSETAGEDAALKAETPRTPAPPSVFWWARWAEHMLHNEQAIAVFNDAVVQYNDAIHQFPANLLAWAFGFKPARGL